MTIRSFCIYYPEKNKRGLQDKRLNDSSLKILFIFAAVMAKYILLFCILLGVFLVSGFESVSGDMKEYKELRVTGLQQGKTECNISEAGAEQCRKVVYGGEYASKAIGNIATSVSRSNIPSSQVLRFNALSVVAKIVKSIKVLLPEEKECLFRINSLLLTIPVDTISMR